MATTTFNSNLTYTDDSGSTVTSSSTSDVVSSTNACQTGTNTKLTTTAHISNAQNIIAGDGSSISGFTAITLGAVSVTNEYAVRLRHLGRASGGLQTGPSATLPTTGIDCVEIALQTGASTYTVLGRLYQTESFGPIRMIPQTGSPGYPKLIARSTVTGSNYGTATGAVTAAVEVIACDIGSPGSY